MFSDNRIMNNPDFREHEIKDILKKIQDFFFKEKLNYDSIKQIEKFQKQIITIIEDFEFLIEELKITNNLLNRRLNFMYHSAKFYKTELKDLRESLEDLREL